MPLIKAALKHKGMAFIDVISPCVAFNNHNGSTKSYEFIREHTQKLVNADLILNHPEVTVDYAEGSREDVSMPDGSTLRCTKSMPTTTLMISRCIKLRATCSKSREVVTGLLYVDPDPVECHDIMGTVDQPLNELDESQLCPGSEALVGINDSYR
ncbi:MAG: hypothetical protein CM15mP120_03680 [Pseudomonadota bacterium]|nr:MAG: hypothetical protein CM15mP120_03680 [Pseudomonadota bacterium]